MARPDGWLVNQRVDVTSLARGRKNPFHSRILGHRGRSLIIALPSTGRNVAWLPKGARVEVQFSPPGAQDTPPAPLEAQVVERRLKPLPLLVLEVQRDIPAATAQLTRRTHTIAVTSGKGGTGKSFVALNLAYALHGMGHQLVLVDLDLGTANIAESLGLAPPLDLRAVIEGKRNVEEVLVHTDEGLAFIAGAAGGSLADPSPWQFGRLLGSLSALEGSYEYVVCDTGAGASRNVTNALLAADEVVLVTLDEPPALLDAYGLLKTMAEAARPPRIHLVLNRVVEMQEAGEAAKRFLRTAQTYLGITVEDAGWIREDRSVRASLREQLPVVQAYPASPAARDLQDLAARLLQSVDSRGTLVAESSVGPHAPSR